MIKILQKLLKTVVGNILDMNNLPRAYSIEIITNIADQTSTIGELIGKYAKAGDIISLKGEMGTGKTTLTQGIGIALQVQSIVNSPTYILLAKHTKSIIPLYHADLFRLTDYENSIELDLTEESKDGILVIEWPEIAENILPTDRLEIELYYTKQEMERRIILKSNNRKHKKLFKNIHNEFLGN